MANEEFLGMNIPELDELMGMMPAGMDTDALITLSRKSYEAGQAIARRNKSGEWHYPSKKGMARAGEGGAHVPGKRNEPHARMV